MPCVCFSTVISCTQIQVISKGFHLEERAQRDVWQVVVCTIASTLQHRLERELLQLLQKRSHRAEVKDIFSRGAVVQGGVVDMSQEPGEG